MALTLLAKDANENPGKAHGAWADRHSFGGFPIEDVGRMWWDMILVDLEETAYETGGVAIPATLLGFTQIRDMYVMAAKDPYGSADVVPPDGVTFLLDSDDPENPLLVMRDSGGEVANATTYAGESVWLLLGGLR